jgi:hypothetical protein
VEEKSIHAYPLLLFVHPCESDGLVVSFTKAPAVDVCPASARQKPIAMYLFTIDLLVTRNCNAMRSGNSRVWRYHTAGSLRGRSVSQRIAVRHALVGAAAKKNIAAKSIFLYERGLWRFSGARDLHRPPEASVDQGIELGARTKTPVCRAERQQASDLGLGQAI